MTENATETESSGYHHGDLRNALLQAVGEIIEDKGVGGVSLREAARRAGVSHGAPAHHFGDKLGLLTAFSVEGFRLFGDRMQQAADQATTPRDRLNAIGLEYLRFAMEERAYFELMFRSEMHDREDGDLAQASADTFAVLSGIAADLAESHRDGDGCDSSQAGDQTASDAAEYAAEDARLVALRAWTIVHGLATLWLDGALAAMWDGDDIYALALGIFDTELM